MQTDVKELRAAAECIARTPMFIRDCQHLWNAHGRCQWCASLRRDVQVSAMADYILAAVREDDGEEQPDVTVDVTTSIRIVVSGGKLWINFATWKYPIHEMTRPTRGQFRDLCRGLGIEVR